MVGIRNCGRLGNFLYMTAAMIGYARSHEVEYSVPNFTNNAEWNVIALQHLVNPKWVQGKEDILINELWNTEQHYYEIEFSEEWRNLQIVLNGYWQSFKRFDFCRDEVIEAFGYPYKINEGVCSIHVRRGDYLKYPTKHPVVTEEYLWNAIGYIFDATRVTNFLVHSDDICWCKNIFGYINNHLQFGYSENKTPEQDLVSMSCCEHQICSNSTLALWGAELNQNTDKIVIVPHEDNWFGKDNKHLSVKNLYRPEWIRIPYTPIYEL